MNSNRPDLKSRILNSARKLFFNKGFFDTKTREIAKEAETSESGLFRIFNNKYEILMAVYNDCWGKVNSAIDLRIPSTYSDPRQQIINILEVMWELYEEKPLLMNFIIINTGNTDTLILSKKENGTRLWADS